jgi:hypothetical protein
MFLGKGDMSSKSHRAQGLIWKLMRMVIMDPCLQEMMTWFCKVSQIMNTGLIDSKKQYELISSDAVKRAQ